MRRKRVNPKIKVYKRRAAAFFTLVLILLSAGLIFEFVTRESEDVEFVDDDRPADFDPNYPFGHPERLMDRALLRAAFIQAHGGSEAVDALRSIRMVGVIVDKEGRENSFQAIKKRPNSLLLTFRQDNYNITYGVDEGEIWQRVSMVNREPIFPDVQEEQKQQIIDLAHFFNPVAQVLIQERGRVLEINHGELNGEEKIIVLLNPDSMPRHIVVYLDVKTLLPERVEEIGSDAVAVRTVEFEDYRAVAAVPIPHRVVTYAEGEFFNEVRMSRVDVNVGTMSVAFQRPLDLSIPEGIPDPR